MIHNCSLCFQEVVMSSSENQTQYYSCIGWNGDNVIVATSTGHIVPFTGMSPNKRIKAHDSAVTNLVSAKDGLISSCTDRIKLWSCSMRCMLSINTEDVGVKHSISSISSVDDTILVGSSGSEIWQLDINNVNVVAGKLLMSSHASSPLGLATAANGDSFATTGDDCSLRLWNVFDHNETKSFDLTMPSRTCPAFSPDGSMLAVGFGKPEKENARIIDGKWVIINIKGDSFEIVAERRDVKRYITEMKWHSNGDRIAVGSGDKKICVYSLNFAALKADIRLLSTIDLASTPLHIDFSVDGKYLRTNTENHELFFFEAGSGIPIQESSRLKDFEWDTETCIFTWNVQSVWKRDSGDAGAVKIISLDCKTQERYPTIAASDQIGRIMLFEYPATTSDAQYISFHVRYGGFRDTSFQLERVIMQFLSGDKKLLRRVS
jgi:WD40 repeat protein